MEKSNNFELFYDVLDHSISLLYLVRHDNFFDLLIQSGKNILANDVLDPECPEDIKKKVMENYEKLEGVNFNVEEIRQAFQAMSLRAFKETNLKLGEVTPDTIGFLFSYFINKLAKDKKKLKILDPVVGTGNLLYSTANMIDKELQLYGIDNVREVIEISNVLGNLLNYEIEMFNQDTLSHPFSDMDFVICDLPIYYDKDYENRFFPYLCILEHVDSLKEDGYLIALIPNNFFDLDKDKFFKDHLKASVMGVIGLPNEMFKDNPKSILILSKKTIDSKKCLLVDLPSFNDFNKLNNCLTEIESWFEKMKEERGE